MCNNTDNKHIVIQDGRDIRCDCCGREKLAEIRGDTLVIIDRRHGRRHFAVIKIMEIMKLAGFPC